MSNRGIYIFIILAAIVIVGIWWFANQQSASVQNQGAITSSDDTSSINRDLENVSVQDPDFNAIDADLNSL